MLNVEHLETAYGASQVLFGVSLEVNEGEVVGLLGRNGVGKTTTVRSVMGLTPPKGGEVRFLGRVISGAPSYRIARAGLGLVPEGRQIFPNLNVEENLVATARGTHKANAWTLARVFELFPALEGRRRNMGNQLSGGEQQMLAIGRALLTNPKLLILDEATEGLAPSLRKEIWRSAEFLKREGQAILIIDSHLSELLKITDRTYILEKGRIVWEGSSAELGGNEEVKRRYLGV